MRQSNFELLRILAALSIILLHSNGYVGKILERVTFGSFNYYVFIGLSVVCVIAVNIFLLLFGYFQFEKKECSYKKIIKLLYTVIFFQVLIYLCELNLGYSKFSIYYTLSKFIPNNYYITLYSVVYIFSPYLNYIINNINEISYEKNKKSIYYYKDIQFIVLAFFIFSVFCTIVDIFKDYFNFNLGGISPIGLNYGSYGYTVVNFFLLYSIGAIIKKYKSYFSEIKDIYLIILYCVSLGFVYFTKLLTFSDVAFLKSIDGHIFAYNNPIIILNSIIVFIIFMKLKIRNSLIINTLSKSALTCYLTHAFFLKVFISYIDLKNSFAIFQVCSLALLIYSLSFFLHIIFVKIFNPIDKTLIGFCKKKLSICFFIFLYGRITSSVL